MSAQRCGGRRWTSRWSSQAPSAQLMAQGWQRSPAQGTCSCTACRAWSCCWQRPSPAFWDSRFAPPMVPLMRCTLSALRPVHRQFYKFRRFKKKLWFRCFGGFSNVNESNIPGSSTDIHNLDLPHTIYDTIPAATHLGSCTCKLHPSPWKLYPSLDLTA